MGEESRVFVCVVFHNSDLRPRGYEMAKNFCESWKTANLPYKLVVLDNASDCDYPCLNGIEHDFIKVPDQTQTGGITGAWNILCNYAYVKGAKIITGFADDVQINPTLVKLINSVKDDNAVYGPLTDGVNPPFQNQKSDGIKKNFVREVYLLNGFWLAFTSNFWYNKNKNGELFVRFRVSGDYYMDDWGGQELILKKWRQKYKTKAYIIGDCWLHHTKIRSWKNAQKKYG